MMRRSLWKLVAALTALGCGGGNSTPTGTDDDNGPTPPPPPTPQTLTIAAWTPTNPYWGDTLTLTGTNFGTTPGAHHVWFRNTRHGVCGLTASDTTAATVVSASPTQLRVVIPYNAPPLTQKHPQNCEAGFVRVHTGGRTGESAEITYRIPPRVRRWTNADGTGIARATQLIEVQVDGLASDTALNSISVNGFPIPRAIITQSGPTPGTGAGFLRFVMPAEATPGDDPTATSAQDIAQVPVQLTVRGRSFTEPLTIRRFAPVFVDSVRSVLVPQATPGAPDAVQMTFWVRNFYGPAEHRWVRSPGGAAYADAIGVGTYPYNGPIIFNQPTGIEPGAYTVSLRITRFTSVQSWSAPNFIVVP